MFLPIFQEPKFKVEELIIMKIKGKDKQKIFLWSAPVLSHSLLCSPSLFPLPSQPFFRHKNVILRFQIFKKSIKKPKCF